MSVLVSPANGTVDFRRPFTQHAYSAVTLTNPQAHPVLFKLMTTSPRLYCVRPNPGRIEPGDSVEIEVILRAKREEPQPFARCMDKIVVLTTGISGRKAADPVLDNWKADALLVPGKSHKVHEQYLKIRYLPADGPSTFPGAMTMAAIAPSFAASSGTGPRNGSPRSGSPVASGSGDSPRKSRATRASLASALAAVSESDAEDAHRAPAPAFFSLSAGSAGSSRTPSLSFTPDEGSPLRASLALPQAPGTSMPATPTAEHDAAVGGLALGAAPGKGKGRESFPAIPIPMPAPAGRARDPSPESAEQDALALSTSDHTAATAHTAHTAVTATTATAHTAGTGTARTASTSTAGHPRGPRTRPLSMSLSFAAGAERLSTSLAAPAALLRRVRERTSAPPAPAPVQGPASTEPLHPKNRGARQKALDKETKEKEKEKEMDKPVPVSRKALEAERAKLVKAQGTPAAVAAAALPTPAPAKLHRPAGALVRAESLKGRKGAGRAPVARKASVQRTGGAKKTAAAVGPAAPAPGKTGGTTAGGADGAGTMSGWGARRLSWARVRGSLRMSMHLAR